jgi:hypothetical protein
MLENVCQIKEKQKIKGILPSKFHQQETIDLQKKEIETLVNISFI